MNHSITKFLLCLGIIGICALAVGSELQFLSRMTDKNREEKPACEDALDPKLLDEQIYFPVAKELPFSHYQIDFEDSWQWERTYGGKRQHEGCDLMQTKSERGRLPVISMTDGTIEKIGWLKLGGYRIGIRTAAGTYYYYAHLNDYAPELKSGCKITAGQLLGFVGDSGYSQVEGTVGMFPVHLHIGIYLPDADGTDQAIDPYPYLVKLQNKQYFFHTD